MVEFQQKGHEEDHFTFILLSTWYASRGVTYQIKVKKSEGGASNYGR